MKLIYIANLRMPVEKAYGIQIAKMCEAFADSGVSVTLLVPFRKNKIKETPFEYYDIKENFKFKTIWAPDFYFSGSSNEIAVNIKNIISSILLCFNTRNYGANIIYSRDEWPIYLLSFFRKNIYFEAHKFSNSRLFFYRRFKKKDFKIVVISHGLESEFIKFGFKPENILVAPDGVDLKEFDILENRDQCRQVLNLPINNKIVGYVGQLKTMGMEKGLDDLIKAYGILHKSWPDLMLLIVGGSGADLLNYKRLAQERGFSEKEILFTGQKDHRLIPFYLRACDVLTMPFPRNRHYALFMSPLKMFEYMASKRPIVASDLESVREILNDTNSILVAPDDPHDLANGLGKALSNIENSKRITDSAFEDAKNYTWGARVEKIKKFYEYDHHP